jgi:hypothetical protein
MLGAAAYSVRFAALKKPDQKAMSGDKLWAWLEEVMIEKREDIYGTLTVTLDLDADDVWLLANHIANSQSPNPIGSHYERALRLSHGVELFSQDDEFSVPLVLEHSFVVAPIDEPKATDVDGNREGLELPYLNYRKAYLETVVSEEMDIQKLSKIDWTPIRWEGWVDERMSKGLPVLNWKPVIRTYDERDLEPLNPELLHWWKASTEHQQLIGGLTPAMIIWEGQPWEAAYKKVKEVGVSERQVNENGDSLGHYLLEKLKKMTWLSEVSWSILTDVVLNTKEIQNEQGLTPLDVLVQNQPLLANVPNGSLMCALAEKYAMQTQIEIGGKQYPPLAQTLTKDGKRELIERENLRAVFTEGANSVKRKKTL